MQFLLILSQKLIYSFKAKFVRNICVQTNYDKLAEALARSCSIKQLFFEILQNSPEDTCTRVSFFKKVAGLRPATLLKKRLAQVFSSEFCKISMNTFSYRTPLVAASARDNFSVFIYIPWYLIKKSKLSRIKLSICFKKGFNITVKLM